MWSGGNRSSFIQSFYFAAQLPSSSQSLERDGVNMCVVPRRGRSGDSAARRAPSGPGRQHNRPNHHGGSTNIQCTHSVLESVLVESRRCRHATATYLVLWNSVSFRVSNGKVLDRSDEYWCTSEWLCGGEWYDSVRRQTDPGRLHEDTGDKPGPEIMVAPDSEAPANPRIAAAAHESPSAAEARHSADLYIRTSWVDAALALSELEKVQWSQIYKLQCPVSIVILHVWLFFCECQSR